MVLSLPEQSSGRPFLPGVIHSISFEYISHALYKKSSDLAIQEFQNNGHYAGYRFDINYVQAKSFAIKLNQDDTVFRSMISANMMIKLKDPLMSCQFLWNYVRIKYKLFLTEKNIFDLWKETLIMLDYINSNELSYSPEYAIMIRSRPIGSYVANKLPNFPTNDDFLLLISLSSLIYRNGIFAIDLTGENFVLNSEKTLLRENMTPLAYSNVKFYIPILLELYPPSILYSQTFTSVGFVYRIIYYCIGAILTVEDAWYIWANVLLWGGGGYLPRYLRSYDNQILFQHEKDPFPLDRNILIVLERFGAIQKPQWNIRFPPFNSSELHLVSKFLNLQGFPIPSKSSKDLSAIIGIYQIFHLFLNRFISINMACNIWFVVKRWVGMTETLDLHNFGNINENNIDSNSIFNYEYKYQYDIDNSNVESRDFIQFPKWINEVTYIDINSQKVKKLLDDLEKKFPYYITCPNGILIQRQEYKSVKSIEMPLTSFYNRKSDRLALSLAKVLHEWIPSISFNDICNIAKTLAVRLPPLGTLNSDFIVRSKAKLWNTPKLKPSEKPYYIQYCVYSLEQLIRQSLKSVNLNLTQDFSKRDYFEEKCLEAYKTQISCSVSFPFAVTPEIQDIYNTYAGNLASAMASLFHGEVLSLKEVAGTIWDGMLESFPSRQIPTLIRLHNPWFEPKELCAISEYFLSIGIKYRSTHLIKHKLENFFYKEREIWSFCHPKLPIFPQRIEENMKSKLSIYIPPIDSYNTDVCPNNSEKKKNSDKSENWNLTECQISGMILRAVNNKVNFMNICVKQMNILFNNNKINCYPKMKSGNYYQIYFNTIRNVRSSFIKKLFKLYSVNKKKSNLAELLSFNGETIHSKASLYMQQFSKYDLLIRFEENIQRLFKWYIYSSCNIAFEAMNRRDINGNLFTYTGVESPRKKVDFEISPLIFPYNNEKVSQKHKALFVDDINQSQMNSINEAVNYGLKYILGDQSATFNFQKAILLDNNLQFMVKMGWNLELNALDPDFIVKNANFLYYYMISSNIFLNTFQIYKIVSIACDIVACAYQKQYEEIDNSKTGFYIDSLQIKTLTHVKNSLDQGAYRQYVQYWDNLLSDNSQILPLLELVLKERVYKYNVQDIWDNWKAKYIKLKMAKEIVETIKASTFTNLSLIENSMYCLEKLTSDFQTKPNIAVVGCKSQDLLGYCSNDSLLDGVIELAFAKAIYSFVSESRISNNKVLGSGDINSSDIYMSLYKDIKDNNNTLCQITKKLVILYKLPNFIYNCLITLMNETSFLQYILNLFLKIPTVDYNMAFHICSNIPLLSKCTSYSDTDSKQEYGEIADIIKGEFMKFQSEYVIHFPPESFCSLASSLASAPTFNSCINYVTYSISKYKTFYWPENIGYSICLKLKRWPLRCSQEKFPFHSLIVLRFQNLMKIEESKIVEAGLELLNNNENTPPSNLLEMGQSVQTLAFRVLCTMFEREHCNQNLYSKSKTFQEDDAKSLLNPHHFCHEIYYPKLSLKDIYSHLRQNLASKITKACMEVLDTILNEINKEKLSIEYTRRDEIPLHWTNKTNNLLPYYMKPLGIVHQLIELFILPPKVTMILVSLWKEFEEFQNIQDPKDIQEKLYILIPFAAKISIINVNSSFKSFISTCKHVLIHLFQTSNDKKRETCFKIYSLTAYNDTLVNFIYTMYATNLQAMKIYTSSFTSENPLLTMVEYRSKILRSDASLRIQILYQYILVNYIDYAVNKSNNKELLLKKENIKLTTSKVFTQDYINSNKQYIANGLKMFLLLVHLRLSSAFSRKNTYTFQNLMPKHLPNIHNFLPSHLAFQIIDSDKCVNMLHENFIFPSFSEIPDDFEEMENTKKSDSDEKHLSSKSNNCTLLENDEEKDSKSEEYTENNQINHICKLLRKDISQSDLKDHYNGILMRMLFQIYLLQISPNYPSRSVETVEIQKSKYTLLEAILFFSKRSSKELTKSFNFHWSESFLKGDEENNIFTHYQTVPEILTWSRMRKFCQIISRQLTHEDFWEENPFLDCKYVDSSGNPLASSKPNFSGINQVNVLCYIKPKENIEGDIDIQVIHPITKKIFEFLRYEGKSYGSTENELNLEIPDVLMRVLGRIYGFCILNETPMNLKLPTIFFKKIVGEPPNRQDTVILNNDIAKYIAVLKKAKMSITDMKEKKIVRYGVDKALEYYKIKTPLLFEIPKYRKYSQTEVEPFEIHNTALLEVYIYILQRYYMEEYAEDEIENFLTGIYDIIPKRFFYMFSSQELQEYIQGFRMTEFESFKEIERISEYFYAESEEFKLYHKKLTIDYFFNVIKFHISSSQLNIFWSCFTGTTGYGIPGALQGKIRIMEIPQKSEYDDLQEIKIDPNTLTVYLPAYSNLEEMKIYVNKVIEKCDKSNKRTK
ncbi:HECT domain-containing family protein [Cryptosporidium andersoni]|uniref:HECT domain-containing family protein n=1 Tax=Cryptosporidium andersoni TaxID=117008 RepID=A0A1J4MPM8_9CRYT|nr:HECT domain-containing family protein [Cryptosporidium andersoni]